jgi:hypothetical protein
MVDPTTMSLLSSLLRVETLVELAKGVGLTLRGLHAESAEGAAGRFDSQEDEHDFARTLQLVRRVEGRAKMPSSAP